MKRYSSIICTLTALLMAGAAFVSCSKDEETVVTDQTYTMTVNATKGGDKATKDLSLDGTTLNATWAQGERVTVYNESRAANLGGYLEAQSDGASTTLSGTLTGTVMAGDNLRLYYLTQGYYTSQDGTLEYIASHCDYAEATVTVASATSGNITTTGTAEFENKQSIVKFTLQNASGSAISASELIVEVGATSYTVTPASARSEFFVAIPNASGTVTLTATVGGDTYTYTKSGVTFSNSQYYTITVRMGKLINLSALSADYEAQNGDVLSGTLDNSYQLTVASGATITLKGASIPLPVSERNWAGITCNGYANIMIEGSNTVYAFGDYPGIYVPVGSTLTISGNGSLYAKNNNGQGAGIGAGYKMPCGDIVIESGDITAEGDEGCGIGAAPYTAGCGNITINSNGNITASSNYSAGIGSSMGDDDDDTEWGMSSCGDITITAGKFSVTGGANSAAIGSSSGWGYIDDTQSGFSACGDITITGGSGYVNLNTTPGPHNIGEGDGGACGSINVKGNIGNYDNNSF